MHQCPLTNLLHAGRRVFPRHVPFRQAGHNILERLSKPHEVRRDYHRQRQGVAM